MTVPELYVALNGNYDEAKSRLMNDRLIDKFVLKFLADPTMQTLHDAVASGDIEESFRAAHTMKGVAGNLAFTMLADAAHQLTEQLRPRTDKADDALYAAVVRAYESTISAIKAYEAQKA
ncbi:MAG: Hpt domain-containing protein [Clostridia bacterium]|nr:Hpt domain-containing protein [Clostridia bacterium]